MCGRYSLIIGMEQLVERFGCPRVELDWMPLILHRDQEDYWLHGPHGTGAEDIRAFLDNLVPHQELTAYPVSNWVNNPRNDDQQCLEPLDCIP